MGHLANSTISGIEMVSVLATLPDYSQPGSDWLVELAAIGSGGREVLARNGSPTKLAGLAKPVPQTVELTHIMSMNAVAVKSTYITTKKTVSPGLNGRSLSPTITGLMFMVKSVIAVTAIVRGIISGAQCVNPEPITSLIVSS